MKYIHKILLSVGLWVLIMFVSVTGALTLQPKGEYHRFVTFKGYTEYQTWCEVNDTYIPYLCYNWYGTPDAEVTVWIRYDWWGNSHYTSTGKGVAIFGGTNDDNDKTK